MNPATRTARAELKAMLVASLAMETQKMIKFRICFRVEQTLAGSIEFEAASVEAARQAFEDALDGKNDEVDDLRRDAQLDLDDSQDSIVEITNLDTNEVIEVLD